MTGRSGLPDPGKRITDDDTYRAWIAAQVAAAPPWPAEKWDRIGRLLGVDLTHTRRPADPGTDGRTTTTGQAPGPRATLRDHDTELRDHDTEHGPDGPAGAAAVDR